MYVPIKWLKDYIDLDEDIKTLADKLSDSGSHVESIITRSEGIEGVYTGKIIEIKKHPDADKLVVCKVNFKDKDLQIVTGAKNVFEGAIVPVALDGAKLHNGIEIKSGLLRGVESQGMMCSLEELGYDVSVIPKEARNGIFIFPKNTEVGADVIELLDLNEPIIEFEITPNRPDCLSIIGMALETAATLDKKIKRPSVEVKNAKGNIKDFLEDIQIDTPNCYRYYSRVLSDIKIEPSPLWMQNYLMAAGVRPISNIVDLTNFIMLELGTPMHAFDLDSLKNKKVVVREARDGEKFKTLDGKERDLKSGDILITDGEEIIGLGGIMGGLDSEINENTKNVLIEGACFNEDNIRKTSKRLNLRSEASGRFEKGLDPNLCEISVNRMCHLAQALNIGNVIDGHIDVYKNKVEEKVIELSKEKNNNLMGIELSTEEIASILQRLEIKCQINGDIISAKVPTFRRDINIAEDLIEEVARIYGYANIEKKPLRGELSVGSRPHYREIEIRIKNFLTGLGYNEFMTYSFVSPTIFDKLNIDKDDPIRDTLNILNPLGEDYSIMRPSLIPSMIDALSKNAARFNENVAGFEIGNTFFKTQKELPEEKLKLVMGFYDIGDFYYLKESIEKILWNVGLSGFTYKRIKKSYLHTGRCAEIFYKGHSLGILGEVHPLVLKNYSMKKKVYVAELDFDFITENSINNYTFKELFKYPSIKRDFAFVMDRDIEASQIEKIAKDNGKDLLESFKVFDIYEGDNIEKGKKSLAFSLVFRSKDRTLTDDDISTISENIVKAIEKQLGAVLRS